MTNEWKLCVISGFRRRVNKIFALPGCYVPNIYSKLRTFRDNLPVPSSRVMQFKKTFCTLQEAIIANKRGSDKRKSNRKHAINTRSAKAVNLTATEFWLSIFLNPCIVLTPHVFTYHYRVSTIRGSQIFRIWYLWYHRLKILPSNARRGHFDRCRSCRPMYYFKAVVLTC